MNHIGLRGLRDLSYIRWIVVSTYFFSMCFVLSSLVVTSVGIYSDAQCHSAIYVCILFLFLTKFSTELFFIERAHVANINCIDRRRDPVWISAMVIFFVCGIAVTAWAYYRAEAFMGSDGRCITGFPNIASAPAMSALILLSIILVGIFTVMWRRSRRSLTAVPVVVASMPDLAVPAETQRKPSSVSAISALTIDSMELGPISSKDKRKSSRVSRISLGELPTNSAPSQLYVLSRKSLIGSILFLVSTTVNAVIFMTQNGREHAWFCSAQCTIDGESCPLPCHDSQLTRYAVTFVVCIVHWLTSDPNNNDKEPDDTTFSAANIKHFFKQSRADQVDATAGR